MVTGKQADEFVKNSKGGATLYQCSSVAENHEGVCHVQWQELPILWLLGPDE
jgi:hypothetical protein